MRIAPIHLLATIVLGAALPAQLAGPYTVGPGGNYPNIAAAIAALTASGVSGPVSFLVTANDTGPWTIGSFTGQGPANRVTFDGQGAVALSGTQPMLTLNGCDSVTFRGFNASFISNVNIVVVNAGTTNCVFTQCNFQTTATTSGSTTGANAVFNLQGGSFNRIEDSTFGGSYESLFVATPNDSTTVQRCLITGGGFWIMRISGTNCTLADNFITGNSNYGISCGISGTPTGAANLKIRHNTVYINHATSGGQYCTLRWYSQAAGTEVVDNILVDNFVPPAGNNMWCSGSYRPTVMNYNCLWSNIAGYNCVFATAQQTFAGWQALGFDLNSIQADPLFIAPGNTPPDLRLQPTSPCATAGTTLASVPLDYFQSARTTPVSIGAHEECGGLGASYAVFGGGCAGHAGVPSNGAVGTPVLGTTSSLSFGNLPPPNVAILVLGFSNTVSTIGPLPVQLTPFGAPGCSARVSLDATSFLVGSGGTASYNFTVPNNPVFTGMQIFTQALVLDAGINAMGAITSDAAVATAGL